MKGSTKLLIVAAALLVAGILLSAIGYGLGAMTVSYTHLDVYKRQLNGGDMKSVQGDSGHAQVKMVADVYSHIIDEDRCICLLYTSRCV